MNAVLAVREEPLEKAVPLGKHGEKTVLVGRPAWSPALEQIGELERMHGVELQAADRPARLLATRPGRRDGRERVRHGRRERMQESEPELLERGVGREAGREASRALGGGLGRRLCRAARGERTHLRAADLTARQHEAFRRERRGVRIGHERARRPGLSDGHDGRVAIERVERVLRAGRRDLGMRAEQGSHPFANGGREVVSQLEHEAGGAGRGNAPRRACRRRSRRGLLVPSTIRAARGDRRERRREAQGAKRSRVHAEGVAGRNPL